MFTHLGDYKFLDKTFAIYMDKSFYKHFFLLSEKGNYLKPSNEDLAFLNRIFNTQIEESVKETPKVVKTHHYPKLMICSTALSLVVLCSFLFPRQINDSSDLTKVLGYENISIDKIYEVIEQNKNFTDEERAFTYDFAKNLYERYPNLDYRIFYENLKTLDLNQYSTEELNKKYNCFLSGAYKRSIVFNQIDYSSINDSLEHELGHTLTTYESYFFQRISKNVEVGFSLNEAMNNILIGKPWHSYQKQGLFLNFCLKYVDYSVEDYVSTGIWYLIDMLKANYPGVDIDKIVNTIDELTKECSLNGTTFNYTDNLALVDEIFKMCLINYNPEEPMQAFIDFATILSFEEDKDLIYTYLDQYNAYLENFISYKRIM